MINIDTRLLSKVDSNEFWLLTHIAKRLGKVDFCWPSNKTLCRETGWHIDKLQIVKKKLVDKCLLEMFERRHTEGGRGSNGYRITTDMISIFIKASDLEITTDEDITGKTSMRVDTSKTNRTSGVQSSNEVLTNEVLVKSSDSKESVTNQSLFPDLKAAEPHQKNKKEKVEKETPAVPGYTKFIEIWMETYKMVGIRMPRDGVKIKSLIDLTRTALTERGIEPSETNIIEFWGIFVKNLHKTWAHGSDLSTIDSKYTSLIFELENGKTTTTPRKQSAREWARSL